MNQMMEEKEDAADMMYENAGMEKEKAMNSLKGLTGHSLRKTVVEAIRTANSLDALTEDQSKDESFITGMYNAYKTQNSTRQKREVAGPAIIRNRAANSGNNGMTAGQKLGFAKAK